LKTAGHAQNEQYQQNEQRPAAQREAISCIPRTGALRDAITKMIGSAATTSARRRFRPVIAGNPPRNT
jgi:hypothetical protein